MLVLSERNGVKHKYTDYVIERLFGAEGRAAIEEAFVCLETDGAALAKAKDRAMALVAAAFGDASSLKELPEYFDGIAWGEKLSAMSTDFELGNDFERAYYGLHARYSSHLFTTRAFAEWMNVQVKGIYAAEALGRLSRTLDAAASGNLSGKDAAKIISAKFKIK
ncbi:hypothetical protein LP414_01840 [Polaromonas sp. P1(28)-13]|nr:hypothetical protein LP414_01840 [Polaromonas sp. P1(28)-13]